jgi:hypothetical protein
MDLRAPSLAAHVGDDRLPLRGSHGAHPAEATERGGRGGVHQKAHRALRALSRVVLARGPRPPAQRFTLFVEGFDPRSADDIDALLAYGCDDAVFGSTAGRGYAAFTRRDWSRARAMASAEASVRNALPKARVSRDVPGPATTQSSGNGVTHAFRRGFDAAESGFHTVLMPWARARSATLHHHRPGR